MADVKINYTELINKGSKPTKPETKVVVKAILTNLRTYILNSVS